MSKWRLRSSHREIYKLSQKDIQTKKIPVQMILYRDFFSQASSLNMQLANNHFISIVMKSLKALFVDGQTFV
jgi:hypothetical protein